MILLKNSWEWNGYVSGIEMLRQIEKAGRTCYKSEDKITDDSAIEFVKRMIKSGHHAMIEFAVPPAVKVICDRGISHEIVRHRLFSFAQESTRYCNYSKGLTVILPPWFYGDIPPEKELAYSIWENSMRRAETDYEDLLRLGQSPQEARSILPNSLKTEINICGNVREWRHFFKLRCASSAHPQMRELAQSMLMGFKDQIPVIFDDITY